VKSDLFINFDRTGSITGGASLTTLMCNSSIPKFSCSPRSLRSKELVELVSLERLSLSNTLSILAFRMLLVC